MNTSITINLGNFDSIKLTSGYYKKTIFKKQDSFELCLQELIAALERFEPEHQLQEKGISRMISLLKSALQEESN